MSSGLKNSLVSIIIPSYNNANHIIETLSSVLKQNYTNWECIIVDDGSTDNTLDIVKEWCSNKTRFIYLQRPETKNKGANACRNIGLEYSKGQYVMFLDADDILSEDCLLNRVNEFNTNTALDFVIANTSFYSDGKFLEKPICNYPANYTAREYLNLFLKYELPWTIMSVLWKRETINSIRFDEALPRLQDVDFHIQILLQDHLQCSRLNKTDTYYRSNTGSKSSLEYHKNVINASTLFFNKYLAKDYLNNDQKIRFRRFIILFLTKHIYPFQKTLKNEVKEIDAVIKKSRVFSFKESLLLKLYKFIIKLNLHTKTGLGIHQLTKALKKGLKYE